jgi:hypothetical protein
MLSMICISAFIGCGKSNRPSDLPPLQPCTLMFKQEGKPLADAIISLESLDKSFKWSANGITDANGTAKIVTHGQFHGVPIGEYAVIVLKEENVQEKSNRKTYDDLGNEINAGGMISTYTHVEKEYTDAKTTPLKITIVKGKNDQDFDCGKTTRVLLRTVAP